MSERTARKPLILLSSCDPAAQNIFARFQEILQLKGITPQETRTGKAPIKEVQIYQDFSVAVSDTEHLYLEGVDELVAEITGELPAFIIFPSKHSSDMKIKSLTIHPTGKFREAEFGGKEGEFSGSTPYYQSFALRTLNTLWKGFPSSMEGLFRDVGELSKGRLKDFSVSFEATHHGPLVKTPAFFIEIGSTETEWELRKPAMLLAAVIYRTIREWKAGSQGRAKSDEVVERRVGIGVGGGHYTPRFTKFTIQENYDFGHIVPGYACERLNGTLCRKLLEGTPGARTIFVHGKKNRKYAQGFMDVEPGLEVLVLK